MHLHFAPDDRDLTIVLPFDGSAEMIMRWASEEGEIDFDREPDRANRCTMAFAAAELESHLSRGRAWPRVRFGSRRPAIGAFIELRLRERDGAETVDEQSFVIEPDGAGVVITGAGRAGVLYGAYELLRTLGWQWISPGAGGVVAPPTTSATTRLPQRRIEQAPSMSLGRGFDFTYESMESAELLLWMARNRLDLAGCRPRTAALARKLCIELKAGGHVLESILDPNRVLPNGRKLFDEHPAWYGTPAHGSKCRENALRVQPCFSQPGLRDMICDALVERLSGEWRDADRLDVWGFDTWGETCSCGACRAAGNGSDQTLLLFAALRDAVNRARATGRLTRRVRLVLCSYEGTCTLHAPTRPVPENLIDAGDYAVFYPINRCYAHDFDEPLCATNRAYLNALRGWLSLSPALPVMVGEYYNVSRFEDLPLLFTARLANDLPMYHAIGVRGVTYMHVPLVNWSVRALTQRAYAQLAWNSDENVDALTRDYFAAAYGPHAPTMRRAYDRVERAGAFSTSWRGWRPDSVLSRLKAWDGRRPLAPLASDEHLPDAEAMIRAGTESARLLHEAIRETDRVRRLLRDNQDDDDAPHVPVAAAAVNPLQQNQSDEEPHTRYDVRLGHDLRALRYGLDVTELTTALVAYHDALFRADAIEAARVWRAVDAAAASLDTYYVPIEYEWPDPGLICRDGLTRSQLHEVVSRCRRYRTRAAPCVSGEPSGTETLPMSLASPAVR